MSNKPNTNSVNARGITIHIGLDRDVARSIRLLAIGGLAELLHWAKKNSLISSWDVSWNNELEGDSQVSQQDHRYVPSEDKPLAVGGQIRIRYSDKAKQTMNSLQRITKPFSSVWTDYRADDAPAQGAGGILQRAALPGGPARAVGASGPGYGYSDLPSSEFIPGTSQSDPIRYSMKFVPNPNSPIGALQILSCDDSHKWYADKIFWYVPYLGRDPREWKSRQPEGYINFITLTDAQIVMGDWHERD